VRHAWRRRAADRAQLPQQEWRGTAASAERVDELLVGEGLLALVPQRRQPRECVLLLAAACISW
jgi:hypothetical protein